MEYINANLIDDAAMTRIAYSAHKSIAEFFEDEKNQKEFEEWLKKREKKK